MRHPHLSPLCFVLTMLADLGPIGCADSAFDAQAEEPWSVLVEQVDGVEGGDALVACAPVGDACAPVAQGGSVLAPSVVRAPQGGSVTLRLSQGVQVELAAAATLHLEPGDCRVGALSAGAATFRFEQSAKPGACVSVAGHLAKVAPGQSASLSARVLAGDRAALTVHQGLVQVEGPGPSRASLRAGDTVAMQRGMPPDLRAAWSGRVGVVPRVGASPSARGPGSTEPQGLGRMTARVPGSDAVVSGVSLTTHHVRVVVRDGFARTEIEEEFYNDTGRTLEGRYVFPLPPRASISRLALWVGDTLVEGEVVERKRAAAIFKGIVDDTVRPRDPALLEWVSGGEFSLKIFPIPPKKSRRVVLAYNEVLPTEGGVTRYRVPLSLGAERATQIGAFSISVEAYASRAPLRDVQVIGYPATLQADEHSAKAQFAATSFSPDSDFVLSFATEPEEAAVVVPAWSGEADDELTDISQGALETPTFALRLRAELPPEAPIPVRATMTRAIALDKSASQGKATLAAQVRLAMGLLRRMTPDERFAVLACDTSCAAYPAEGLAPVDAPSLEAAERWLRGLEPSGASDVAGALLAAGGRLAGDGTGQVVYVGDGTATAGELEGESIAGRVARVLDDKGLDVRLVGAGRTVDEVLMSALARSIGATYERLRTEGPLSMRIEEIADHMRAPVIRAASVELPEGVFDVVPRVLPNLRLGEEMVITGKAPQKVEGSLVLRGRLEGRPYVLRKAVRWPDAGEQPNPLVPRLWAEARIAELGVSGTKAAVEQIVALSKRYHVMSRHTALLVLENEPMFREFGVERTQRVSAATGPGRGGRWQVQAPPQVTTEPDVTDEQGVGGSLWGGSAGESFGAGGLGLSGIGEGGGGRGDDIGLGPLGTLGRGAGAGRGQGFGSGHGRLGGNHRAHAPRVRMGAASINGRLPPEIIQRIVRQNFGRFRACYERGLRSNPSLQGRVAVRFLIGRDGAVVSVGDAGSSMPDTQVAACVRAAFRGLAFPAPEGGLVTVIYPILLQPSDSGSPWAESSPRELVVPAAPRAVTHRGESDAWRQRGENTIAKLRGAVAREDRSRKAHVALVLGLLRHGRFDEALVAASRFARLDPDLPAARELLAQAAAANGQGELATRVMASLVETSPSNPGLQVQVARAYEALGDALRACAHWRAAASLAKREGQERYEAMRCRASVLGEAASVLREATPLAAANQRMRALVEGLEGGAVPAYDASQGAGGDLEVVVTCDGDGRDCPAPLVIDARGRVYSPWTPSRGRSGASLVALYTSVGTYRTLLVGGGAGVKGRVRVRARDAVRVFAFEGAGGTKTIAATEVPWGHRGRGW